MRSVGGEDYSQLMQLLDFVPGFVAAVGVAFAAIVVRKTASLLWLVTTWIGRGVWWLLVGWWVARLRSYMEYGF